MIMIPKLGCFHTTNRPHQSLLIADSCWQLFSHCQRENNLWTLQQETLLLKDACAAGSQTAAQASLLQTVATAVDVMFTPSKHHSNTPSKQRATGQTVVTPVSGENWLSFQSVAHTLL